MDNGRVNNNKRVCIIGAGPCGMSAIYQFYQQPVVPEIVCFEKQGSVAGLWNYSWRTGTDQYGEPCHHGMYRALWSNGPKECLEYPDYTFEQHFGHQIPSFPPREVLKDYIIGRFKNAQADLENVIRFRTVVKNVCYDEVTDQFDVVWQDLHTGRCTTEKFTHVIVAVGIFNFPNKPSFPGIETFPGRILHSHDFRNAEEFKGQRLLIVGASYSAEDIAMQTLKYGAKSVVCTWRTKPMNFKWPKGITERPLLQKIDQNTVFFKDGSTADFDSIILCTGYLYNFPFMENNLRLESRLSLYPENLYKGSLFLKGGNHKLFYMGVQDQYYTFTMFDAQALWISRFIMETLNNEPKTTEDMERESKNWVTRCNNLTDCHGHINFQTDFIGDLCKATGYNPDVTKPRDLFHTWEHDKHSDILTYRDKCFASVFSGSKAPLGKMPWFSNFDDTKESFVGSR